jgi:hypothetical protein
MADEEQPRSSSMRPLWEMGLGSVLALLLTLVALNLVWISQNVAQVHINYRSMLWAVSNPSFLSNSLRLPGNPRGDVCNFRHYRTGAWN